ncbi:unnamed protein product, partial [marine sediment metagenome]
PTAMIAATLMNGLYTAMNDMLTEFDVGKKDALNPQLMEVTQVAQQMQQKMQELMQQVGQLGNQNQQLQATNSQLQGILKQIQGQGMAGQPMPPPGVQGSMPMGGGPQGQGGPPPSFQ